MEAGGHNRNNGIIHTRVLTDLHLIYGIDTKKKNKQANYHGKNRPFDKKIGKFHKLS
jgi:hypothetical protein